MLSLKRLFLVGTLSLLVTPVFAKQNPSACCSGMGGISYCDSSAGRMVCNNGFYSTCFCTPHAVMDLQLIRGCCLWKGGVVNSLTAPNGLVVCNDGSVSEECSLQTPADRIAAW
ncbi:neurogenic locus notch [Legionella saoudiensis]|uniref:neurogenic locus notch n=1 Tax=Legionella saoudiensis TaxID=1750561 RepID=UPI00098F51EA|nr:neurogenic locus notch [Legionella saoudiensis]